MTIRQKISMMCCVVTLLCTVLIPGAAQAATNIYMRIEGIQGDVTAQGYENWIEVVSVGYSFGRQISAPTTGGGARGSSEPSLSEIKVLKNFDIATPLLLTDALVGKATVVTIHFVNQGAQNQMLFFELKLSDTLVSTIRHSFQPDDQVVESLTLNFVRIEWTFTPFDNEGKAGSPISGGYDIATGTKL